MKSAKIIVNFDEEKLDALTFYIAKKDVNLQSELAETVEKLYEKHVPQSTREYLEDKQNRLNATKK